MDLRACSVCVLSSSLLLLACKNAEPQPIGDSVGLPNWDVAIEPTESQSGLEVCVDGVLQRPRASFVVRNNTGAHTFPVTFTPTSAVLTLSPPSERDSATVSGGISRMFTPDQTATIDVELLEPFGASPRVAIQLPFEPVAGRRSVDVFPIVDVRALDVELGPPAGEKPTIVVRNPFPYRAAIMLKTEGKWRAPAERQGIDGRASITVTLEPADGKPLSDTTAAKVTLDGDRCTTAALPEHAALEIP